MRIAVIKGSSIGDIITGIPLLRNLKKNYPGAHVTLIASYRGAGELLVNRCPYVDDYVVFGPDDVRNMKTIWRLRERRFDLVINGYPATIRSSFLRLLIGGRKSGCVKGPGAVFGFGIVVDPEGLDATEAELLLLRKLGMETDGGALELPLDTDQKRVGALLKPFRKKVLVGINPGKDDNFNRTWENGKWAALINSFGPRYAFVLVGSGSNARNSAFIERHARVLNLTGTLSLDETAAVIKRCDLFLTVNGGPMHIAAALRRPLVVLNGPSQPQWNPHARAENLGGRTLCHETCNDNACHYGDARCIKRIEPRDVREAARKATGRRTRPSRAAR